MLTNLTGMKSFYLFFCCFLFGSLATSAQNIDAAAPAIRPAAIGFGVTLYDFTTAQRIRRGSLSSTINNKRIAKFRELGPGGSVYYAKGLRPKLDFAASLGYGSGTVYLENNPEKSRNTGFVTADAGIQLKLLTEAFAVNPFVSTGVGVTVTQGFYGAIVPVGLGVRFRITDDAAIVLQSQYRSAITETAGYHFVHGITIMGKL
jgi:OmpA-OmpF porin, OOP family